MTQVHETYKLAPVEDVEQLVLQLQTFLDQIAEKFAMLEGRDGRVSVLAGDIDHGGKRIKSVGVSQAEDDAVNRLEVIGLIKQSLNQVEFSLGRLISSDANVAHSVTGAGTVDVATLDSALDALASKINDVVATLAGARFSPTITQRRGP